MSAPPAASWQAGRRILCIRLDSPGDVLMCTPAMHCRGLHGPTARRLRLPRKGVLTPPLCDGASIRAKTYYKNSSISASSDIISEFVGA